MLKSCSGLVPLVGSSLSGGLLSHKPPGSFVSPHFSVLLHGKLVMCLTHLFIGSGHSNGRQYSFFG